MLKLAMLESAMPDAAKKTVGASGQLRCTRCPSACSPMSTCGASLGPVDNAMSTAFPLSSSAADTIGTERCQAADDARLYEVVAVLAAIDGLVGHPVGDRSGEGHIVDGGRTTLSTNRHRADFPCPACLHDARLPRTWPYAGAATLEPFGSLDRPAASCSVDPERPRSAPSIVSPTWYGISKPLRLRSDI